MRKWINIAESIILVVMLVFVIGFHKYYTQPICLTNRYMSVGSTWDGNKLDTPKDKHPTFIENLWHSVGYDSKINKLPAFYSSCLLKVIFYEPESYTKVFKKNKKGFSMDAFSLKKKLFFNTYNEIYNTPVSIGNDVMLYIDNLKDISIVKHLAYDREIKIKIGSFFMVYHRIKQLEQLGNEGYYYIDNGDLYKFMLFEARYLGKETLYFNVANDTDKWETAEITVNIVEEQ